MKIKNLASIATLALAAFTSPLAAQAAPEGNIYEIHRVDIDGNYLPPLTEPLTAGSQARFVVRLMPTSPATYDNRFKPVYMGLLNLGPLSGETLSEIMAAFNPFQIGIYVSGVRTTATLEKFILRNDASDLPTFTDLIFVYEVKAGDFALPIRLADANGDMMSANKENDSGYWIDPASASTWKIQNYKEDGTTPDTEANFQFYTGSRHPTIPDYQGDHPVRAFDLSNLKFNVKTVDFLNRNDEEQWDIPGEAWREVSEGSPASSLSKQGHKIALKPAGIPEKAVDLYVWAENQDTSGLKVTATPGYENTEVKPGVFRSVRKISIEGGVGEADAYVFQLMGTMKGKTDNIVLSAFDHYTYNSGTEQYEEDFLRIPVKCGEPEASSIMVTAGESPIVADENYKVFKTTLSVKPTGVPYADGDYTVKLEASFSDGYDGDWKKYVHLSLTSGPNDWASVDDFTIPFAAGESGEKTVYVYALGGDAHTSGAGHYLNFKPVIAETAASDYYTTRGGLKTALLNVDPIMPSIISPASGTTLTESAKADVPYTVQLKVSDTYANLSDAAGYTISYKCKSTDPDWTTLEGTYTIDSNGYLKKDGKGPAFTFPASKTGLCSMRIMVKAPSGYSSSEEYALTVQVDAPDMVSALVDRDDKTYMEYSDPGAEVDATMVTVTNVTLSAAYDQTLYAFFKSDDPEVMSRIDGRNIAKDGGVSDLVIIGGQLSTGGSGQFNVLDGNYTFSLDIVLCKTPTYDATQLVESYKSSPLTIYSKNVQPKIMQVSLGADDFYYADNGKTMPTKIPLGATRKLTIFPAECDFDLSHVKDGVSTFQTYVKIKESDGTFREWSGTDVLRGNPELQPIDYEFTAVGKAEISIKMMDKDMTKFGEEYKFYVEVADQPMVSVEDGVYNENAVDEGQAPTVKIHLTEKAKVALKIGIKLEPRDPADPGVMTLDATEVTGKEWQYEIDLPKNTMDEEIYIKELDGTVGSKKGWIVTAMVVTEDVNPVSGTPWSAYYGATSGRIQIANVEPEFDCSLGVIGLGEASTNAVIAHIGANEPVTWSVNDIKADLDAGVKVQWYNQEDGGYKEIVEVTEAGKVYTFIPTFKSSGTKKVICYVWDKDMGVAKTKYEWTFEVAAAKTLKLYSNGPAGRSSSSSSTRYINAVGRGEGHAWAQATFSGMQNWVSQWLCGDAKTVDAYAWGYKTSAPVDDGSLNMADGVLCSRDIPITISGSNDSETGKDVPGSCYTYNDPQGRDSFLYAWLIELTGDNGGTEGATVTVSPERYNPDDLSLNRGEVATVNMPTEQAENGDYGEAIAEAVFSRELYPSDNMGDINFDGIPDLFFTQYKFGLVGDDGALSGDDMAILTTFNDDEDYLPNTPTAAYARLIPGLKGTWATVGIPFTAQYEIRGYGEAARHLNDAPAIVGFLNVKPDRVYENPLTDDKSTLSYVEWLAWSAFKAAYEAENGEGSATVDMWSPERPTDPTLADTDGDGLPDGYEYFFWYQAHVGYLENGTLRKLTGRRYDPRNPGEGTLISSETIAYLMDPRSDRPAVDKPDGTIGGTPATRDSDNDGLPDLLEFELGTNPFDFDSDGDGLPDGYEIMIAGSNPLLLTSYTHGIPDYQRNFDSDAMAISSYELEKLVLPTPANIEHAKRWTFAMVDPAGDTDGVQWYATKEEPAYELQDVADTWWKVTSGSRTYAIVSENEPTVSGGALAVTKAAYLIEEGEEGGWLRGYPVILQLGTRVDSVEAGADLKVAVLTEEIPAEQANACWIYGKTIGNAVDARHGEVAKTAAEYGCLALGRHQAVPAGELCMAPLDKRDVAFLHYLCYQEFGFDPRTAWSADSPLASRWAMTINGEGVSDMVSVRQGGYVSQPTRTRAYTAYDEFLLYSFFVNNGVDMGGTLAAYRQDGAPSSLAYEWGMYTTNPMGPGEVIDSDSGSDEEASGYYWGRDSDQGADTDGDGVPDGWELYVMAGPKQGDGTYTFAPPYAGFPTRFTAPGKVPQSYWSPFLPYANSAESCHPAYVMSGGQIDELTELREFSGTDSCAHYAKDRTINGGGYAPASTTILPREEQTGATGVYTVDDSKWLNKFFPTDPWNNDTDGDGIIDHLEGATFKYGEPADDGAIWSIPGAGLNPCAIDTDLDGLPDGWEKQYAGKTMFPKDGKMVQFLTVDGNQVGNPLQGLIDGMDGTVMDAYNVGVSNSRTTGETTYNFIRTTDGRVMSGNVDRDYDHDGLENWQEYLTGAMRCWRYDDPISPFEQGCFAASMYCKDGAFDLNTAVANFYAAGYLENEPVEDDDDAMKAATDEFLGKTFVDASSPIYNPYLAMAESGAVGGLATGAQYFSPVTNGWDLAFYDGTLSNNKTCAAFYMFYNRAGDKIYDLTWGEVLPLGEGWNKSPTKYIGCSPLEADTDHDGLDDYYELYHGMNPLLGASGVQASGEMPCDIVYDAWRGSAPDALEAWGADETANFWQQNPWKAPRGNADPKTGLPLDFEVFPWLNGLQTADPDGDNITNEKEGLMPLMATATWLHTDPTPLWMTDASYTNSLVSRFFRFPTRFAKVDLGSDSFVYNDTVYNVAELPGFVGSSLAPFVPDLFGVAMQGKANWAYSFEQNEGYDTDHDVIGDNDEISGKFRATTDPQDADSPKRRQAMYFQGPERPSALQTMPAVREDHPLYGRTYPDELAFMTYTVECWAKPETSDDATLVERAIWIDGTKAGDREYLRRNFQIAIKNGFWYTKYDSSGTEPDCFVEVLASTPVALNRWTHLAATYDGESLVLYVNGVPQKPTFSHTQPEYGSSALAFFRSGAAVGNFEWDDEYQYASILVGASFKGMGEIGVAGYEALDLCNGTNTNWTSYKDFFKGYIDEIRIWDGARSETEINQAMNVRYTREMAAENRNALYSSWNKGERRYAKDAAGEDYVVTPELRYHFHFDSVPGAVDEESVAIAPRGFDYHVGTEGDEMEIGAVYLSRPEGYEVSWMEKIRDRYPDTVYSHPAWVMWIPNTVAHLPRYDGTTLDSSLWSADYCGTNNGVYAFARTCEPVSLWTQYARNDVKKGEYKTTASRYHFVNGGLIESNTNATQWLQYEFNGRHLMTQGDDLLPLGGAFVKYSEDLWDGQGATTTWEISRDDSDSDGMPDAWEEYARQNYSPVLDPSDQFSWDTMVTYNGILMTAGEAYRRDLAKGFLVTVDGMEQTPFKQVADTTNSKIPDWWEDLYNIVGQPGTADTDNDGLNNRSEYLVSEVFPFGIHLNPLMSATDTVTNDYFRTFGNLYLGEMFSDHDMMEDHWERQLGDSSLANPKVWDALQVNGEDGWNNFAKNRYNGSVMSTLPQLVSHLVGDAEVLDSPTPTINLTVRYNGERSLTGEGGEGGGQESGGGEGGAGDDNSQIINIGNSDVAALVVQTFSGDSMDKADATYTLKPGVSATKSVYLGGWENRVVRGTMGPGHIDVGSFDIYFAQITQSDLYSWTDPSGQYFAQSYAKFKEALAKYPELVQNVQTFKWNHLVTPVTGVNGAVSDKAITFARDAQRQYGYIAVYGVRVGTVDIETGAFSLDLGEMFKVVGATYDASKGEASAWSLKEAIFRIDYAATVPSVQQKAYQVSLARPDTGYVNGGRNSIMVFYDLDGQGYTPGVDPMGIIRDCDIGWSGNSFEVELKTMSAITPRVNLWSENEYDRGVRTETVTAESGSGMGGRGGFGEEETVRSNNLEVAAASAMETRVRVLRYQVDNFKPFNAGTREARVIFDRIFQSDVRQIIHEGDFLADGALDIDWADLYDDVVSSRGVISAGGVVTNVNYLIVFGDDPVDYDTVTDTNKLITAHPVMISRRFERERTKPTAVREARDTVCLEARPTFRWRIDGEDIWASRYGTTYTAFKVLVSDADGNEVYDSGFQRMPAADSQGVYSWQAPLYVGAPSPSGAHRVFKNLANYTWRVYIYNAKFKDDADGSDAVAMRTNVSTVDGSSFEVPVRVCYTGPAKDLAGKVHVQAFTTPDFSGLPAAETVLAKTTAAARAPLNGGAANAVISGLRAGTYYLRAYIDTDGDFACSDWESWGYLCERDHASVAGTKNIFSPVEVVLGDEQAKPSVRQLFIEDCDTNGNCFPDVWEAEQNGNKFDPLKIAPASGNTAFIAVNPELKDVLKKNAAEEEMDAFVAALTALNSANGVALMAGVDPAHVSVTGAGFEVKSEIDPETLTIIGLNVDAAQNRVLLKVGAETTAKVDAAVANFLNITVRKGAEVTVKVEHADSPNGPWTTLEGVGGTVTVDEAGRDIAVDLKGELPAQGFFRAKIAE